VKRYLTIFIPKRTQEGRNGKGKNRIGSNKLREIYLFLSKKNLMLSECGSSIKRWSQKNSNIRLYFSLPGSKSGYSFHKGY
jgi:hypothetical protein